MNVSSANGEQPVLLIFCYCIGSYFLLLSKVVNIIGFDQGSTVEFSSPEFINLFHSLDGVH